MRRAALLVFALGCFPEPASDGRPATATDGAAAMDGAADAVDAAAAADAGSLADGPVDAGLADGSVDAGPGGCEGCHGGIEAMHPAAPLSCTDCHGGDPRGATVDAAHVARPADLDRAALMRLAPDQLDALDPALLRFVNPGDLRVADRGCGAGNPQAAAGGCHQPIVERARRSVMQTYVGHYALPRFLAGLQDRAAIFAAVAVEDPEHVPDDGRTVAALTPMRTPAGSLAEAEAGAVLDRYLPQQCPWCHTASFGRNDAPRNYRSSGCSACHVLYADDGRSRSADPTVDPSRAPHPTRHALTTAPPTAQCERCHYQGARIGLSFQGIREGGFAEQPPRAVPLGQAVHGHGPGFYLVDEDEARPGDETPPDIHFERGMHCVDCHTEREVHGDGRLHSTAKGQLEITCTDCHGTVRAAAEPGADGVFRTASGAPLTHLHQDADGSIWLTGKVDGARHPVTQIEAMLTARSGDPNLQAAMGVSPEGVSHTDTMECWTCHTGWRPSCLGCHVTLDDRFEGLDQQSGARVPGLATGARAFQALDLLVLGVNGRGRIDTLCPSMQVFFNWVDADGQTRMRDRVRQTADGRLGYGWMPTFAHTIRPRAQPCARCHLEDTEENRGVVRETYGFGAPGRGFTLADDQGRVHDLTQVRTDAGETLVAFPHLGSGPVPMDVVERAMGVRLATGRERCDGEDDDGDGAVDEGFRLASDPRNCGACGHVCPDPAPICALSRCLSRGWVAPGGDDAAEGSRGAPWATLEHALAALPGDARRILLLPGEHRLPGPLDVPPGVEIEGAGLTRDDVVLVGALRFADAPQGALGSAVRRVTLRAPVTVARQGLQIFDVAFDAPRGEPAAVLVADDASVGFIQCEVRGGRGPLVRGRGGSVRVLRSHFADSQADGAPLIEQRGGRLVLSNDSAWRVEGPLVRVAEGARLNVTLSTVAELRGDALLIDPTAAEVVVANSVFAEVTGAALRWPGGPAPRLSTNLLWASAGDGPTIEPDHDHPGAIAADPLFVDLARGDLRLQAGSPAIDVGDPVFFTDTDQRQVVRPQGAGVDLGAFERVVE